ncbi:hypothetical protein [Spiroplasma endosymbiont of Polydrusus pterygomalis]|uniref:hypothetical protein n=1 Tax=Spiroplasma endosymbiont of Polydrusus pterygomalis TaxID=3139327 RepID=UPI003CCA8B2B
MKSNKNIDDTEKKIVESNDDVTLTKPKVKKVTKKQTEKLYSEEDLNVALYYEVSSTIYNSLNNLIVRKAIFSDEQLLKILELQISNLFFLEKELKELKDKTYALEFLQLISNLVDRSLSITKSSPKNRIEILEERNLLIVTITNICKTVEKESLERIRQFDDNTFNELNDQIIALNNFSNDSNEIKPSVIPNNQVLNNNGDVNTNVGAVNNPDNNLNINNLDNASLANLTKLGVLPQHPATNPKFYPYINKPKYIPLLKKILSGFFLLTTVLTVVTYILTYFVAGTHAIKAGDPPVYYNFGQQLQSMILTIIMTIVLNGGFLYSILKPPKLGRDVYRTSYFLIVILILWIVYTVVNLIFIMRDDSLLRTFDSFLGKDDQVDSGVLAWLKGLSTFKAFQVLTYVTIASTILPIAIILVIAILNPRIDRNKIMRANAEYQNAINSALNGKPYEIDPTLFDDSLDNNKKDTKDHKFWRNSDLFK